MLAETLALVASRPAAHSWHIPSVALDFLAESTFRTIVIHVPMSWRVFRAGGMEWAYRWHLVFLLAPSTPTERRAARAYQSPALLLSGYNFSHCTAT